MINVDNPSILIPTEMDNRPVEEATVRPEAQLTMESSQATVASTSKLLLPLTDCLLVDTGAPSPTTAEISSAEEALRNASGFMKTANPHDTWRNACTKIEWVMNVVSPIAEVRTLSIVANFNYHDFCLAAPSVREDGMELTFNHSQGGVSLLSQKCAHPSLIWMPDFLGTGPARREDSRPT